MSGTLVGVPATAGDLEKPSLPPLTAGAEANRGRAEAEATRLLALAVPPGGAVPIPVSSAAITAPAVGRQLVESIVTRTRAWRLALPYDQALAWLTAHPPAGMRSNAGGSGSGPGYREEGLSYPGPASDAWQTADLALTVQSVTATTSELRADASVIWLDPTPLRDDRPGLRVHVGVAGGCPKGDPGVVGVRNEGPGLDRQLLPDGSPTAALVCTFSGMNPPQNVLVTSTRLDAVAAARIAVTVRAIPLGHVIGGVMHCPADLGRATLVAFSFPGRPDVDLWGTDGCSSVSNGVISASGGLPTS